MLRTWLCAVVLSVGGISGASAWGSKGHVAIAAAATTALTPTARAQVVELLADDLDRDEQLSGRRTLAAIASWPDEIREVAEPDRYRGWHGRSNSVCSAKPGRCRDGHCVDQLILSFVAVLADHSQAPRSRNEALKWIVHLVGDMHQPLHAGIAKDHGKVPVLLGGAEDKPARSLHQVWDSELAVLALAQDPLKLPASLPVYSSEAVSGWMLESRDLARTSVYEALPGFSCESWVPAHRGEPPLVLDANYQAQALPVIRLQMERAAARLAALLNATLR